MAGAVCLIVGLIVFYTVKNNALSTLMAMLAIATGAIMASFAAIVLAVILIIHLITKSKNKKNGD